MEAMPEKTLRAIGKIIHQFDNIANFLVRQEYWCEKCDGNVVDSDNPDSGKFFQVSGCIRKLTFKEKEDTGDWETVIFALCKSCLET